MYRYTYMYMYIYIYTFILILYIHTYIYTHGYLYFCVVAMFVASYSPVSLPVGVLADTMISGSVDRKIEQENAAMHANLWAVLTSLDDNLVNQ